MKVGLIGVGYVGSSLAALLAKKHKIYVYDIDCEKALKISEGASPVGDQKETKYLQSVRGNIFACSNLQECYKSADIIFICLPTNFDPKRKKLDTSAISQIVDDIAKCNSTKIVVIKSTVPICFCKSLSMHCKNINIIYCPEFLRESRAFFDINHPDRLVIGFDRNNEASAKSSVVVEKLFESVIENKKIAILKTGLEEAESIKLFANTYLAMRIAFFNELDTFALIHKLNSAQIINGVCLDKRIGNFYNNPSFGFGGYCLPKDSKELSLILKNGSFKIIPSVPKSNIFRLKTIERKILSEIEQRKNDKGITIGIYRLIAKTGGNSIKSSASVSLLKRLKKYDKIKIVIYEPYITKKSYLGCEILNNIDLFKANSNLIIANREDALIDDVKDKVFSRDIFHIN